MGPQYGILPGQHIPGMTMHKYLEDYARHHDILRRIRFQTRAVEIEKLDDGAWRVLVEETCSGVITRGFSYLCRKIVAGTGLSSTPNPISIPGMESFDKTIFSTTQLTAEAPALLKTPAMESITVLGGSKTAYDSVYTLASAGKRVTWIIRKSGLGPLWMNPEYISLRPFKVKPETLTTIRFFTWFSPCVWGSADGYCLVRRVLNNTRLGRYCMHAFWQTLREAIVSVNGYRKHHALAALEPDER